MTSNKTPTLHSSDSRELRHAEPDSVRRILFITHRVPYPPDKGDRIRTFHLIRFLSRHHQVYLASLADETVSAETRQTLEELCVDVAIVPVVKSRWLRGGLALLRGQSASIGAFYSSKLVKILSNWQARYSFDIALASASSIAWYLRIPALRDVPALVDVVDVDSQKWLDYSRVSAWPRSWLYRRESTALRRTEQEIATWAKQIFLVSDAEAQLFGQVAPQANAVGVTNGVDLDYFFPAPHVSKADTCVFVGALDYRPNVDAALWFSHHVWPKIHAQKPNSEFHLVGRNPVAALCNLTMLPGVKVIGAVPDVRPFVRNATLVVAPLRIARGLQNKVLEAMAMGKPVVASPQACAGLKPGTQPPLVQADSAIAWETAILELLNDKQKAGNMGRASRLYVEQHYRWLECLQPLLAIIDGHTASEPHKNKNGLGEPELLVT